LLLGRAPLGPMRRYRAAARLAGKITRRLLRRRLVAGQAAREITVLDELTHGGRELTTAADVRL
jgi:hypothetical protein